MREIKFRAWDKDNKEMLYELDNKGYHEDLMKPFDNLDTKSYYEIMQFTGLFDKNGKEIYEGDIIEYKNVLFVVEWEKEFCQFKLSFIEKEGFLDLGYKTRELKIIGNIYENPELVEDKK